MIWGCLAAAVSVPILIAARSPLLQWRQPIYIVGGFAGIVSLAAMLCQPLLVGGYLPGLPTRRGRRVHRVVGTVVVLSVVVHVAGLWITSPPDMIDALTFSAPTAFSAFGVISMWMLFAAAGLALARRRIGIRSWRAGHASFVSLAVLTAVAHAMLIEGTMGMVSKAVLCLLVLIATGKVMADLKIWRSFRGRNM
ncbi:putative ferric reductase [Limimaricola variabilis]|uniref:Ferric reductase n=1 Tax=Limimaricola variabilis TaxID=1492771 RepID=A0ABR6HTB4_9RHOB|nr:ferric reductase-like transmembrane domain-containing protein [Limimaricola variabilis]MBB3713800.1 putative ferric reductase [Limimaricola variabilis]